jgi:N-acetyl sugar amidotransferase
MKEKPKLVCSKTVLDSSYPGITFDSNGISRIASQFETDVRPNWKQGNLGRKYLEDYVNKIKVARKDCEYDCLLGLSGGADSSYMLHLMVKEHGLRPLVFHVDGGWNSELAVNNIFQLVDALGVELFTEVINWDEMRDFQLAMFRSGVPHLDVPQDMAFISVLYKFASEKKIPYILNGGNISTEAVPRPVDIVYWGGDMVQNNDILKRFSRNKFPTFPFSSIISRKLLMPLFNGVRVLKPLNYVEYTKPAAMKFLENEYGWKPYPQKHFESRFTRFYEGYWLPTRFNFDMRTVDLSSLILTGQISREEALEILNKPPFDIANCEHDIKFIADKLDITMDELMAYHTSEKKFYWNYKNQMMLLEIGEWFASKVVGGRRGGAF